MPGITTELVIESADTDVAGQIQQLQNLMAQGRGCHPGEPRRRERPERDPAGSRWPRASS